MNVPVATTTPDYRAIATQDAQKYGINAQSFLATIQCESHFDPTEIGDTDPKYHGESYGIAQIHLVAHSEITKEQALNPYWALDWMAQQFKAGNQGMWTCWRIVKEGAHSP